MKEREKLAVIFGVGPAEGVGGATAMRFARAGYRVIASGRNAKKLATFDDHVNAAGLAITTIAADATDPEAVRAVLDAGGDAAPDFVLQNVGSNWPTPTLQMDAEFAETMWRNTCLVGIVVATEALKRMVPAKAGTLVFTGASASMRGKPMFAGFAMAKAGLRAYAQACAREFGPQGIHVAHVIIDGIVDGERVRGLAPQLIDDKPEDGTVDPAAVAETFWQVHQQPKNAWTHEMEVRPYCEDW